MALGEDDLAEEPVRAGGNRLLLQTEPLGWSVGKTVSVNWKNGSAEGLVTERSIDADTLKGNWQAELLLEIQN